jgi:hypothetical protein
MRNPLRSRAVAVFVITWSMACHNARTAPEPDIESRQASQVRTTSALSAETVQERQIVRNGRLAVEVKTLDVARTRFESATAALSGQIIRSTTAEKRAEYLVRVPAARLDALMDSAAMVGEVDSRTVTASDVTEQLVDLEARLSALRATRDRLRQLLERADEVQDVISVERELGRVQGELESLEGRLQLMRTQVAMSELTVRITQKPVLGPLGAIVVGATTLLGKLFVWR